MIDNISFLSYPWGLALLQFIFVTQSFVYVDVTAFRIDLSIFSYHNYWQYIYIWYYIVVEGIKEKKKGDNYYD